MGPHRAAYHKEGAQKLLPAAVHMSLHGEGEHQGEVMRPVAVHWMGLFVAAVHQGCLSLPAAMHGLDPFGVAVGGRHCLQLCTGWDCLGLWYTMMGH